MKKKFKEFYNPNFKELWDDCTFVFDTSVLLNLYRMNDESKDAFLEVMDKIKDRLWIPYQVGYEYHKHRIEVINEVKNKAEKLKDDVNKDIRSLKDKLNELFKQTKNSKQDKEKTTNILDEAERVINKSINNACKKANEKTSKLINNDEIQEKLNKLFESRVGNKFDDNKLNELYKVAEERYKNKIPPGYKDNDKTGNLKYSDYVIWSEIINFAKANNVCIVFVTADEKEDWWQIYSGKKTCLPALKKEFYDCVDREFHMYTPEQFLEKAKEHFGFKYSEDVIDEVKAVRRKDIGLLRREIMKTKLLNHFNPKANEYKQTVQLINLLLSSSNSLSEFNNKIVKFFKLEDTALLRHFVAILQKEYTFGRATTEAVNNLANYIIETQQSINDNQLKIVDIYNLNNDFDPFEEDDDYNPFDD